MVVHRLSVAPGLKVVFAYVTDPLTLPRWNSAVEAVRKTPAVKNGVTSTCSMEADAYRFAGIERERDSLPEEQLTPTAAAGSRS